MLYHYVFRTYKKKPFFEDEEIRDFLKNIFQQISLQKGFRIIAIAILAEHVHLLIEQGYTLSPSLAMKCLKGVSSRRFFEVFQANRYDIRKLWGRSFYARKINSEEKEAVINYITNQRNRDGIDKRY